MNVEIERRANALITMADETGHGALRISGGWRSDALANAEWERRYTPTTQTRRLKVTDKLYEGVWYSLNPGEIGVATPGNSWHTTCPPDALTGDTGACAIDWYQELAWMQQNCARVGLRYSRVVNESHHTEPVEYPSSRRLYNPSKHKLTVWPLPGEDTMAFYMHVAGDTAIFRVTHDGGIAQWLTFQQWVDSASITAKPEPAEPYGKIVTLGALQTVQLRGPGPWTDPNYHGPIIAISFAP